MQNRSIEYINVIIFYIVYGKKKLGLRSEKILNRDFGMLYVFTLYRVNGVTLSNLPLSILTFARTVFGCLLYTYYTYTAATTYSIDCYTLYDKY